jgi:hypothetical protein
MDKVDVDIICVLRNYYRWLKKDEDRVYSQKTMTVEDIDADETFGEAIKEIERLRAIVNVKDE